jgi:hypothetical protein
MPGKRTRTGLERLSWSVATRPLVARSANLERDFGVPLDHYLPTARAIDGVRRWARSMVAHSATRSWSITGPYGSGKSSFALLLSALASSRQDPARQRADEVIRAVDPELGELLDHARAVIGASEVGLVRVLATARSESVSTTLDRALSTAIASGDLGDLAALNNGRSSDEIVAALARIAASRPVLVVIDEFGKNLDYHVQTHQLGDTYLLQRLAELASGPHGLPIFLFTLQHLSFADYLSVSDEGQRREWAKIQGRFEDMPFAGSRDELMRLVEESLQLPADGPLADRIDAWADGCWANLQVLGLTSLVPGGVERIRQTYPFHPIALLSLPDLCSKFGQFERTLFTFLGSKEPGSLPDFLDRPLDDPLPVIDLSYLYDFFIGPTPELRGQGMGRRTLEVVARVRDTTGIGSTDTRLLKSIAALNVIGQGGLLRASPTVVAYAAAAPDVGQAGDNAAAGLDGLVRSGVITYRSFADEYRVWQGTDFDLAGKVEDAAGALRKGSIAAAVEAAVGVAPVVAGRHSQERGIYRRFDSVIADGTRNLAPGTGADGLVVFAVADPASVVSRIALGTVALVLTPNPASPFVELSLEAAALRQVLADDEAVVDDWVARRELSERASEAAARARTAFAEAFNAHDPATGLQVVGADVTPRRGRLSSLVSDVCDAMFGSAPIVRNEMLSRDELTAQAARARRTLLEAIAGRATEPTMGFEGYGPERALYEAVLVEGGMHQALVGGWQVVRPPADSSYLPAWQAIEAAFDEAPSGISLDNVQEVLRRPPYGVPRSVTPILLTAILVVRSAELAVYQDGTYQPALTPELLERMVKIPSRFIVRAVATSRDHIAVLETLTDTLGIELPRLPARRRNSTVLAVAGALLRVVRNLPPYSVNTRALSPVSLRVREVLLTAREPDTLLFVDLPQACGLGGASDAPPADNLEYSLAVKSALRELSDAYDALLSRVGGVLATELETAGDPEEIRREAASKSALLNERVLEPRLRAFLHALGDAGLDYQDWLASVAMTVTGRPPQNWRDDDEVRFALELRRLARSLFDAEALNFESILHRGESAFARKVTVVSPDGSATSRVVWIGAEEVAALTAKVDSLLAASEAVSGRDGVAALMAVLAERLARTDDDAPRHVADASSREAEREF